MRVPDYGKGWVFWLWPLGICLLLDFFLSLKAAAGGSEGGSVLFKWQGLGGWWLGTCQQVRVGAGFPDWRHTWWVSRSREARGKCPVSEPDIMRQASQLIIWVLSPTSNKILLASFTPAHFLWQSCSAFSAWKLLPLWAFALEHLLWVDRLEDRISLSSTLQFLKLFLNKFHVGQLSVFSKCGTYGGKS